MTTIQLDKLLSGHVFAFVFIFARLGSAMMLFPGIGESYVPARMRLMFAFALSFLVMEPMLPHLPTIPLTVSGLAGIIGYEILIGLFFGSILRLILNSLETTGSLMAVQLGLSNAMILNPTLATQSPLPSLSGHCRFDADFHPPASITCCCAA